MGVAEGLCYLHRTSLSHHAKTSLAEKFNNSVGSSSVGSSSSSGGGGGGSWYNRGGNWEFVAAIDKPNMLEHALTHYPLILTHYPLTLTHFFSTFFLFNLCR